MATWRQRVHHGFWRIANWRYLRRRRRDKRTEQIIFQQAVMRMQQDDVTEFYGPVRRAFEEGQIAWPGAALSQNPYTRRGVDTVPHAEAWKVGWLAAHYRSLGDPDAMTARG